MRFRSCLLVVLASALPVQSNISPDSSNSGLVLLKLNTSNAVAFRYEDEDQGGSNSTYREDSVPDSEHGTDIKTNGNAGVSEFYLGSEGGQKKLLCECDFNSDSCLRDKGLAMKWIKTTSADGTKSKYQPPSAVSGKDGYFMMVDVTNKSDSDAAMSSRFISQEGHRRFCLKYYFSMQGANVHMLAVYVFFRSNQNAGTFLLSDTGNQGPFWYQKFVSFETTKDSDFFFQFVARQEEIGDGAISVDKLQLIAGSCDGPEWQDWQSWGECSVTCGDGERSRTRICDGLNCKGSGSAKQLCFRGECPANSGKCGNPGMFGVIGGHTAKVGAWPWHVGLYRMTAFGRAYSCGATILSETYVITAAHCLYQPVNKTQGRRISAKRLRIRAGSSRLHRGAQYKIEEVLIYPRYRFLSVMYDIALLRLDRNLTYNEFISPVCLPPRAPKTGESCFGVGWGRNSLNSTTSPSDLQQLKMEILENRSCKIAWGRRFGTARLCAGKTPKEETVYKGDSGGSFTCFDNGIFHLQGVTSIGNPAQNKPPVFTDVWYYKRWIEHYVK